MIEQAEAFRDGNSENIMRKHTDLTSRIVSEKVLEKMNAFDEQKKKQPLFCVMRGSMQMVLEMLPFIRAVRTGDWNLHLVALELFVKYFFAHDRINYSRMMPLYLGEMKSLRSRNTF